jgi:hypothetical protein
MAQQNINTGSSANSNTGDPLRTCFIKTEENFTELYDSLNPPFPFTGSAQITGSLGVTGSLTLEGTDGILTANEIFTTKVQTPFNSATSKIELTSNTITLTANSKEFIKLDSSTSPRTITINPNNENIDFRARGQAGITILHVDAGTDRVGIRTTSPQKDLHVNGDIQASEYYGDITEGDPEVAGQFFQISSEELGGTSPYYQVVCLSQG